MQPPLTCAGGLGDYGRFVWTGGGSGVVLAWEGGAGAAGILEGHPECEGGRAAVCGAVGLNVDQQDS